MATPSDSGWPAPPRGNAARRCELGGGWGARLGPRGSRYATPRSRSSAPGSGPASRARVPKTRALLHLLRPRSASQAAAATAHGHWLLQEEAESACGGMGSGGGLPLRSSWCRGTLTPRTFLLLRGPPCALVGASSTKAHSAQGSSVPKVGQCPTRIPAHPGDPMTPEDLPSRLLRCPPLLRSTHFVLQQSLS